ncbi:PID-CTERM protein-sorting domain-containing protein [Salegentibacter chungangensis]|uniref:PID-CTERM protein-sorting domain-containing protein n=1 Tax=Salegentibacter chungangensis TaxID=1335724 RepID=A0ABW3NMX0_9FLAO
MLSSELYSQAQSHNLPQPQSASGPGVPPPPGLPIDFGISALIASGVALGVYHIRRRKED